jgi:hypothetical protein
MRLTEGTLTRDKWFMVRSRGVRATILVGMFLLSTVVGSILFGGLATSSPAGGGLSSTVAPASTGPDGASALGLAEQSLQQAQGPLPPVSSYTPTTRGDASMTYDAKDGYVVMFGGATKSYTLLSGTSKFVGGKWTMLSPSVHPTARFNAVMAYDSKDRYVVLFGGAEKSGVSNDTWKFVGGTWTKITTAQSPPARYDAVMTYDSKDGYLVLFGGYGYAGILNDTWTFVGGVWTNETHSHHRPPPSGPA